MTDPSGANEELIQELSSLRQRIAELEQAESEREQAEETLRESEERYRELSTVDDLTQIYNSRQFYIQLKIELDRSNRYDHPLTLLLLDLDDFKAFNDTFGHIEGDQVLWRLGQVVKRCLRQTDTAYRYGGDEFTIILPMTTSAEGIVTAERIRTELKKENFSPTPGSEVAVKVSIGIAQYQQQEDLKAFVNQVDQLMYQGKKDGKDKVCFQSPAMITKREHQTNEQAITNQGLTEEISILKQRNLELEQSESERTHVADTLRLSEENFRRSLDESPLGVAIVSEEGKILYANRVILYFFGYESIKELRETPFTKRYTESNYAKFLDRKEKRHLHADDSSDYEIDIVRKDGEICHLQVWRKKVLWYSKEHYQVIYRDITDRKQAEEVLRRSEENFRTSLDDSPMGVRIVSKEGETIYANHAILDIYGYDSIDELRTTPSKERYSPESYAESQIRKEKRKRGDYYPSEYDISIVRKNGEVRHLQVWRKEILWNGEEQFHVIYQDISERKKAEDAPRASEGLLRGLFENMTSGAAIYEVINDGSKGSDYIIRDFNVTSLRIDGKRKDEVIGKSLFDLRPNIDQYGLITIFQKVWRTGEPGYFPSTIYIDEEYSNWYENRVFKLPTGEIVAIYDDVTERKQAEEKLRASRLQLRALSTRLHQIREEERAMIAREIHDEMGGGLTGLKLNLSWLLRKMSNVDPGETRVALINKIHTSNTLIDQMILVVRRIATDLRPSVLDDLGLIAALEWQLSEFTSRTELPHEFTTTIEYVKIKEDTAVAVFRIFQEALTNVVRHSRATKVAVVLREGERSLFGDESFILEIKDNGRGITEEEILNPKSLGLLGMKERVLTFGGELSICGEPGGGTDLVLQIPLKQGESS